MLMIGNEDVARVLTMRDCIRVQEEAFAGLLAGTTVSRPRIDTYVPCDLPDGYYRFGTVEGTSHGVHAVRMKSDVITWPRSADGTWVEKKHCVRPGTYCGLVFLYSTADGEPLAIVSDGHLQHMRVGGAAGIGTKLLSRSDSRSVGMIGSGGMARTFLEAICAVRDIRHVKVYSRSAENRRAYAEEMSTALDIDVVPVESGHEAVRRVDIVSTCTDSMEPVIEAAWLEPGMHVVTLGLREIDAATAARFDVAVQQGIEGLPIEESANFRKGIAGSPGAYIAGTAEERQRLPAKGRGSLDTKGWPVYTDVISGKASGRTGDRQITHYRTVGNWGVQFSAVGALVYAKAKEQGLGRELPTEWFLQDIRN